MILGEENCTVFHAKDADCLLCMHPLILEELHTVELLTQL